jgi:hypothetical protein
VRTASKTGPLDQDARRRRAGLPGVLDPGVDQVRQRRIEVGIGEHDLRALAAELERDRHDVLRGRGLDQPTGADRAGERQMGDARMRRERRAGLLAEPGDDVQRAVRQPGLDADPGEREHRQAGLLGRLQHARIAHRERGADAAPDDLHRVVPRHDVAGHAVRLAQRQRGVAVLERQGRAVHLVGGAAVELEVARQRDRVGAALLQRLADVERFEPREHLDVVEHLAADRAEQPAALGRGQRTPGAVERGARCHDAGIDVGAAAARDRRERPAVRRVLERDRLAALGGTPAAADQQLARIKRDVGFHGVSW